MSCREAGEARRARRSLCPFLFLPDVGFLLPESSVTVKTEDWKSRELILLILCIILGILFLGLLIFTAIIFLKVKGKYGRFRVLGATGKTQRGKEAGLRCGPLRGRWALWDSSRSGRDPAMATQPWPQRAPPDGKDFLTCPAEVVRAWRDRPDSGCT